MAGEWEQVAIPGDERVFYINRATQETRWTKPVQVGTVETEMTKMSSPHQQESPAAALSDAEKANQYKEGVQIVWDKLNFTVKATKDKKKIEKTIINNNSGFVNPGTLTAVIGASGAGKTTLMNLLAGKNEGVGERTGRILLNGVEATPAEIRRVSGFVFQEDSIFETSTVREALTMSALLRLPKDIPRKTKLARVDEVIEQLHLKKCQDTIVGSILNKGISGGEKKRCAIGMELISNPKILFLDEPTSGLDTFTAFSVIKTLKDLSRKGHTVLCTIHQPSSEIWHLFDNLVLLSEGEIMYCGPAPKAVDYFAVHGFPCPQFVNPADFFFFDILRPPQALPEVAPSPLAINVVAVQETAQSAELGTNGAADTYKDPKDSNPVVRRLLDEWLVSPEGIACAEICANPRAGGIARVESRGGSSFCDQFRLLFHRAGANQLRHKMLLRAKTGQVIIIALVVGLIFLQLDNDQNGISNRQGALFFCSVNLVMSSAMSVVSLFAAEKTVFYRETQGGYYGLPAYFFSKLLVELPLQFVLPWVFATIVYWMIGLQEDAGKYFIFVVCLCLLNNCGVAIGIFAACLLPSLPVAMAVVPLFLMPLMVFSGFFINSATIPVYFSWIQWISPIKYGFTAIAKNEFTGLGPGSFYCEAGVVTCPYTSGDQVIDRLNFNDSQVGTLGFNIGLLVVIWVTLLLMSYLALWRVTRSRPSSD